MTGDGQVQGQVQGLRKGTLGPAAIAFFVISAAGPLVAMAGGIPIAMLVGNGPGLPAMFALATTILLVFAIGYTAMARHVRNAGAFYAFAARGLGGRAAGATGMVALLSYNGIQIGLYGLFGAALDALVAPATGLHLPWWLYALAAMAGVATLGYRQVDLSAKVLGVLVAGEYLVVLVLDVAIVAAGGDAGLTAAPLSPALALGGAPAIGLMLCFSAFVGFEATTIYSEEARDPDRTIPLATYGAVALIGGFYTLSTWAVVEGVGVGRLMPTLLAYPDPTALLFDLARRYAGGWLPAVMRVLFVTSIFAALLAFHNAIARYFFAMGRERILFAALGRTHPRTASPHVGSLAQTALAAVTVVLFAASGADPVLTVFTIASAVATLGILALMTITALAVARYFLRAPHRRPVVAASALLSFVLLAGVAGLATVRFDVIAGTANLAVMLLPALVAVAAMAGVMLAARLRAADPARYAALGANEA